MNCSLWRRPYACDTGAYVSSVSVALWPLSKQRYGKLITVRISVTTGGGRAGG